LVAVELADTLRELKIDESWIHEIVRRGLLDDKNLFSFRCKTDSEAVKKELLAAVNAYVGPAAGHAAACSALQMAHPQSKLRVCWRRCIPALAPLTSGI